MASARSPARPRVPTTGMSEVVEIAASSRLEASYDHSTFHGAIRGSSVGGENNHIVINNWATPSLARSASEGALYPPRGQ
jgi:hypothetical protein